jgi:arylsulfatase A-like enzyme/Tfp pilus assembly protein PilF
METGRRALVAAATVGLTVACRWASVSTWPDAPVIVVSIDTLRADHLGAYGYSRGSTPNLDALARESVVFETAYSHCPLTLPSHASLFTGKLPPRTGVRDNIGFRLKEGQPTLATRLKAAGWRTGGAVSAFVLRADTGIAHGFDFYEDALTTEGGEEALDSIRRDGALAVEALSRFLTAEPQAKTLAFLHLYEPHAPCTPPERYRGLGLAYDGAIAYADELVGRLVSAARDRGLLDRAIFVVLSDHGEGLGDHGEQEHGIFLYREALHVPLMVRLPRGTAGGRRIRGPVGLADVAPTLLDLVGLPIDGMDGASLRDAIVSGRGASRPQYSETLYPLYHFGWSDLRAAADERYHYIRAPRPELFDLREDPRETRNLSDGAAATASAMEAWLEKTAAPGNADRPEEVSDEVRQGLQALGYVTGGPTTRSDHAARADPKDRIRAYERLKQAMALHQAGRDVEAVPEFRAILAEDAGMFDAWLMLGLSLLRLDRTAEAIAALDKAVALDPTRAEPHMELARIYALQRRPELALRHADLASRRDPGQGLETLAQLMLDAKRLDEAASFARRSLAADPSRSMSSFVLGVVSQRQGRYEEALSHFRRAEESSRRSRGTVILTLHASMGDCLARLGREAEAEAEFLAEIKAVPWSEPGRVGLAMLYRSEGRDSEARTVLADLIAAQPKPDPDAYWTVVRTLAGLGDAAAAREWAERAHAQFPKDGRFGASGSARSLQP